MNREDWIKNVIIVSGGFDPVHKGHIRMFREAANFGANVIVGLNSDEWLTRKKGKPFMGWEERAEILECCKFINQVIPFYDSDDTANDAGDTDDDDTHMDNDNEPYKYDDTDDDHKNDSYAAAGDTPGVGAAPASWSLVLG